MSKAALDHYTRSRTHELAKKGIRINNLNPGIVKTNILTAMGFPEEKKQSFYEHYEMKIPLGRSAKAEEMAKPIAFLASDDASYITGVALLADGGHSQFADV
uniref:SDR family oxidoreductase n=1 Tax=Steinernema glaseri TaxID=37863 RepID=A0A1I7Z5M9_9BILA